MFGSLFSIKKSIKTVIQSEASECGLASLTMIANYYGHGVDLPYMRAVHPISWKGVSMAELYQLASTFGLDARGLAVPKIEDLAGLKMPAILHWNGDHFVVLESIKNGTYIIQDPAVGRREFEKEDIARFFSGVALEFTPRVNVEKIVAKSGVNLWAIARSIEGVSPAMTKIMIVSFTVSLLALATPVLLQVALDFVLPQADVDLLGMLAISLTILLCFEAAGKWLRDMIILRTSIGLQLQVTRSVVSHAFRLPLPFFEARHPGDIVTRLESIDHVKEFAVNGMIRSLVDSIMSVLVVTLMYYYSPTMATAVIFTLLAALSMRFVFFSRARRYTTESLVARSEETSTLLDGISQITALKSQNATRHFENKWFDQLSRYAGQNFLVHRTELSAQFCIHVVVVLGTVLTLYMGVGAVILNEMSIGMLYAFFALRGSFFDKMDTLTTNLMHLSIMGAHLKRLEDIVAEKPEATLRSTAIVKRIRNTVTIKDVAIQFSATDAPILSGVSFSINVEKGEKIAIIGESGSGKSSLLKIIASLTSPSAGHISVDGLPIERFGLFEYRNNIGAVFAGDGIVKGTVAENVTLFDPTIPMEAVIKALETVGVADEVANLPQGLATLITEENALLSTGQRRRVLAARAIVRNPRLLLFDEITANLDGKTENALLNNLDALPSAKIYVTHSDRLLAYVDRVYEIRDGQFIERQMQTVTSDEATLAPL